MTLCLLKRRGKGECRRNDSLGKKAYSANTEDLSSTAHIKSWAWLHMPVTPALRHGDGWILTASWPASQPANLGKQRTSNSVKDPGFKE